MKQFPNHIRSKSILQKIFLKNEQRKASKLITAEHDGQRLEYMRRFKAGVNFALFAKFMTDLKCGEAQGTESFLSAAAATLC